ncbi:DUF6191 domain-containing protein [Actinophytocola sp.]|uniref:DUF6191 domain-containing protein n=1 Tax=Actinophytocola sp. TaxID=1872138 RepID=UPI002ED62C98
MGFVLAISLPGLVLLLCVLVAMERFGLWASSRSWLPWRRKREGMPLSAAGFEELDAFFGASKRHELNDRNHSLMLRDDTDDGAPPLMKVDLDGNRVVLRTPSPEE